MSFEIASAAFVSGEEIPKRYTCDGDDVSPPLSWTNIPDGTKSLVLIIDDPDAPDPKAPRVTWVHWVLYNIPSNTFSLLEAVKPEEYPSGTREGQNDWGQTGYRGPCPPVGRHRYFHKLYALGEVLPELDAPRKSALEKAMEGHVLAKAEVVGTYKKK